jgi:redox-sensitive bicupin YhaK (pirin superfamily)
MNMKRKIQFISQGRKGRKGEQIINHLLPNRYASAVGPFVLLEQFLPTLHSINNAARVTNGISVQPHRGIARLTYILNGEAEHFDSAGYHDKVSSGGIHWTKAGNGIMLDEIINVDPDTKDLITHTIQFWINLPAGEKANHPDYLSVRPNEVPKYILNNDAGWLKLIAGEYMNLVSGIPAYTKQFLFHIHLKKHNRTSINTNPEWNYAALLLINNSTLNDTEFREGDFLMFENSPGLIDIVSNIHNPVDIILFGGEPITESIVVYGPFVMNTKQEIAKAYADFHEGKYGRIRYK